MLIEPEPRRAAIDPFLARDRAAAARSAAFLVLVVALVQALRRARQTRTPANTSSSVMSR